MEQRKKRLDCWSLLGLNLVGGLLVLGSYASVFGESEAVRAALWGGVPAALRPVYAVSMIAAALGYFAFSWQLIGAVDRAAFEARSGLSYGHLLTAYALLLFPSALWLPLTVQMIRDPGPMLWMSIRLVLIAVAMGSVGILGMSLRLARTGSRRIEWLAPLGAALMVLQTAVFDALIWPAYYPD